MLEAFDRVNVRACPAAVDDDGDAGGERALVAGEIDRERCDFLRGAEPAHRLAARRTSRGRCGPAAAARSSIEGVSMVPGQMQLQRMPLVMKSSGDRARQRRDRGLGRAVDVAVGRGLEHAGGGRDVDDRAAAAFQHARQERADGPVHRLDVEVEREIPVLVGAVQHGAVVHEAGGIEQDVGLADALGDGGDGGGVAHVEPCHLGDAFLLSVASLLSSMSVANTVAPSRAKAIAQARPMPAAAAVTNARFPFRRSDMFFSFIHCDYSVIARSEATKQSMFPMRRHGLPSLRSRNDGGCLVIIPRHADRAGDVLIARGEFHAGAGGLLADGRAIEFLPRRLVGRVGEAALGLQLGAALLQLRRPRSGCWRCPC